VNYGDGNVFVKEFQSISGSYKAGYSFRAVDAGASWLIPQHVYIDGFTGVRNITFEFENPNPITRIDFNFIQLRGNLPSELNVFSGVEILRYQFASFIETIPDSFPPALLEYTLSTSITTKIMQ